MDAKQFTVEKDVEINNNSYKKRGRIPKYEFPFATMQVGESFVVEKNTKTIQSYLINRANNFCQSRKLNWKFTTHKTSEGYRVFRIK